MSARFWFPLAFPSCRFQPRGVILRNSDAKDKFSPIVAVDLFNRVANGHGLHKWNLWVWIIHCQKKKKKEVSTTLGGFPVLCCTACEIKTTQHPTTVNFKKKEIHWLWLLRGHFKVKAWAMAWSVVRGLRTRRAESGLSHCYGVKRFRPFDGSSMQPKIPGSNKKQSLKRWKEASSNESVWIITDDTLGSVFQLWEYFCTRLELCTNAAVISLIEGCVETVVKAFFLILALHSFLR